MRISTFRITKIRALAVVLCFAVAFTMAACGGSKNSSQKEKKDKNTVNRQIEDMTYYLDEKYKTTYTEVESIKSIDYSAIKDRLGLYINMGGINYVDSELPDQNSALMVMVSDTTDLGEVFVKFKAIFNNVGEEEIKDDMWTESTEKWNTTEWNSYKLTYENGDNGGYIDLYGTVNGDKSYWMMAIYDAEEKKSSNEFVSQFGEYVEFTDDTLDNKANYDLYYIGCDWIKTDDGRDQYYGTYTQSAEFEQAEKDGEFVLNEAAALKDSVEITEEYLKWISTGENDEGEETRESRYYIDEDGEICCALVGSAFDADIHVLSGVTRFKAEKDGDTAKLVSNDADTSFFSYERTRYEFTKQ